MSDIVERLTAAKNQGIDSYAVFCEVNEIEALLDDAIAEIMALDAQHDTAGMMIGFWAGWRSDG